MAQALTLLERACEQKFRGHAQASSPFQSGGESTTGPVKIIIISLLAFLLSLLFLIGDDCFYYFQQ